ncbi:hypothetical protein OKW35_009985 [Paraburkholderia sp. MM5477-R1]
MAAVAPTLGVVEQALYNWVKADREGKLARAGAKPASPEQAELAGLRAEVARLKMERDILKRARALREGIDAKYAFIECNRRHWPVSVLCEELEISPSGYYPRRQRAARDKPRRNGLSNDILLANIKAIYAQVKGEYSSQTMWVMLSGSAAHRDTLYEPCRTSDRRPLKEKPDSYRRVHSTSENPPRRTEAAPIAAATRGDINARISSAWR